MVEFSLLYWLACFFILISASFYFPNVAEPDTVTMVVVYFAIAPWLPLLLITTAFDNSRN